MFADRQKLAPDESRGRVAGSRRRSLALDHVRRTMAITPNPPNHEPARTWVTPSGPGITQRFIAALQPVLASGILGTL